MLLRSESLRFTDRRSLLEDLSRLASAWRGKTSILAGHFMLIYRESQHRLVPLIQAVALSDPCAGLVETGYAKVFGDFAEATFELGVQLALDGKGGPRSLLLLVDDHQFQRLQKSAPKGDQLADLRRQFYRSPEALPLCFSETLTKFGCTQEIFEDNSMDRPDGHTLPSKTFFFSENILRKAFTGRRRDWLLRQPGFLYDSGPFTPGRLLFRPDRGGAAACLIDEQSELSCSGTAVELLLELGERSYDNLVWFIPQTCKALVSQSVQIVMPSLARFENVVLVSDSGVDEFGKACLTEGTLFYSA
jgi:hypothetical protein